MKLPSYDKVILTGTIKKLNEYIEHSGKCLVVDWRSDEGSLIDALGRTIPEARLTYRWGKGRKGEDDIYLSFGRRRRKVGLTMSGRDRYITLRRLNEILAGAYELRGFRHTLGDDTHCFYPKPCSWWTAMQRAFPTEIMRRFAQITTTMDFSDYL